MSATDQPVRDREVTILADRAGLVSENQLLQGRLREGRVLQKCNSSEPSEPSADLANLPELKQKDPNRRPAVPT